MATTELDPQGDIVLSVGEKRLLSSSKVLSLASPVFRAMFGSQFSEGRRLSTTQPGEIPLTDDDPEVFFYLASIFHHR